MTVGAYIRDTIGMALVLAGIPAVIWFFAMAAGIPQ
jgi:hypothetical protein